MRAIKPERESAKRQVVLAMRKTNTARVEYNDNKRKTLDPLANENDYIAAAKALERWRIATIDYTEISKTNKYYN